MNLREALVMSAMKETIEAMVKAWNESNISHASMYEVIKQGEHALALVKQEQDAGNIKQEDDCPLHGVMNLTINVKTKGCVCPPHSEHTCQSYDCPRHDHTEHRT